VDLLKEAVKRVSLAPRLESRVNDFQSAYFGATTVGVHVRHSDRRNSFENYHSIIERLRRTHGRIQLFLATDNSDVEAYFRRRYSEVLCIKKEFAPPGIPLHGNPQCGNRLETAMDAVAEMALLSRCSYLIYKASSTFAVCASLMSDIPPHNQYEMSGYVLRARRWLKDAKRAIVRSQSCLPSGAVGSEHTSPGSNAI
jgi:hypothetical protein